MGRDLIDLLQRVHGDLSEGNSQTMRKKPMKVGRVRSTDELEEEPLEKAPRRPTELLLPTKLDNDPLITPKVEPTTFGSGGSDSDLLVTPKVEAPPPLISPKAEGLPPYFARQESSDVLEVDVKEALRASICQKTKIFKPIGSVTTPTSDEESFISSIKVNVISDKNGLSSPSTEDGGDFEAALTKGSLKKLEEDEETLTMRRERNRLAAQRCRQRRRDRIDKLEKICGRLEHDGSKLELEITDLERELSSLRKLLQTHSCVARRKGVSLPPVLAREGRT